MPQRFSCMWNNRSVQVTIICNSKLKAGKEQTDPKLLKGLLLDEQIHASSAYNRITSHRGKDLAFTCKHGLFKRWSWINILLIGTSLAAQWLRLFFHCRAPRFDHWLGNWILHAMGWGQKKRLKIYIYMVITEVYLQNSWSPSYIKLNNMLCTDMYIHTCNYEEKPVSKPLGKEPRKDFRIVCFLRCMVET